MQSYRKACTNGSLLSFRKGLLLASITFHKFIRTLYVPNKLELWCKKATVTGGLKDKN